MRSAARTGLMLLALASVFRLATWAFLGAETFEGQVKGVPFSDARGWHVMAAGFAAGDRSDPAWEAWGARRPFYYVFMGSFFALFGASMTVTRIVNLVLGLAGVLLVYDALRRILPHPVAAAAACSQALLEHGAKSSLTSLSEPLGGFLTILALWAFVVAAGRSISSEDGLPPRLPTAGFFALSGISLALANLARPLNLPSVALLPLALLAVDPGGGRRVLLSRRLLAGLGLFAVMTALTLAPWLARQQAVHGILSLSDNTWETLYGATSPEHGEWGTEVAELVQGGTMAERVSFYKEGVRRNLEQHLRWYLASTARNAGRLASRLGPKRWVLLLAILLAYLALMRSSDQTTCPDSRASARERPATGAPEQAPDPDATRARTRTAAIGIAVLVVLLPRQLLCIFWVAGLLLAIARRHPAMLLAADLLGSAGPIVIMALSGHRRFTHSLEWTAAALACWAVWSALEAVRERAPVSGLRPDRGRFLPGAWGPAARPLRLTAAAGLLVFALGLTRASLAHLDPPPPPGAARLPPSAAAPWLEEAVRSLGPLLPETWSARIEVRRGSLVADRLIRFGPREEPGVDFAAFAPRAYGFTVFETRPAQPETYLVHPGDLPRLDGDLMFVGIHVERRPWASSFEVLAVAPDGEPPSSGPRRPALPQERLDEVTETPRPGPLRLPEPGPLRLHLQYLGDEQRGEARAVP